MLNVLQTRTMDGELETQTYKERLRELKCSSPAPLPACNPICGLVELKGCRLWRQQLAAFV